MKPALSIVALFVVAAAIHVAAQGAGPANRHVVDPTAAERGKKTYAAECLSCHGSQARGSDKGPNLIRSVLVLHDRNGDELGPFLKKGHRGTSGAGFTQAQIEDLAHFVHQRVYETLRSSPTFDVQNVLTGDREAGLKYFNGDGKCTTCHSATGDLAGIGSRYDAPTLQQRFVFPRSGRGRGAPAGKPVTVTVTPPSGAPVTGVLVTMDDFTVALRDANGEYHSWKRAPGLSVVKSDPYAAHIELLEKITDQNIHDVVAYLERLK
jgi:cytochrome c oxidase cbb3-type subunit 3